MVVLTIELYICLKIQSILNALRNIKNHFEKMMSCLFFEDVFSSLCQIIHEKDKYIFLFLCFLPSFNVNYYYENKNNFKFVHVISVKGSVVTEIMYGVLRWHAPFTDVIIKFQQYYLAPDFIIIFLWHTIFICDTSYHFLPPLPPHSSSHGFTRQW